MPNIEVPCKIISIFGKTEKPPEPKKPIDPPHPEVILEGADWH